MMSTCRITAAIRRPKCIRAEVLQERLELQVKAGPDHARVEDRASGARLEIGSESVLR